MRKKHSKKILWAVAVIVIATNIVAYNHAYKFTHFDEAATKRVKPEQLSITQKVGALLSGVKMPRPKNSTFPTSPFETVYIQSHELLEAWDIKNPIEKGIVIMYHGYASQKSSLLPYSDELHKMGYSTFLIDFMGSGGSSGNMTTVGFKEARDVKEAYEYIKEQNPSTPIYLFGSSMGAAAVMKSINEYDLEPEKIILECPFGDMVKTAKIRFDAMGVPNTPFAHILLFYGGLQTGYNPFKHSPINYAKQIDVPTLLFYGAKDKRVHRSETDEIFKNLQGEKELYIFKNSMHECFLNDHKNEWIQEVDKFLD